MFSSVSALHNFQMIGKMYKTCVLSDLQLHLHRVWEACKWQRVPRETRALKGTTEMALKYRRNLAKTGEFAECD